MLNTARSLLGSLIFKPELLRALGEREVGPLLSMDEAQVFDAIADIWEDEQPGEINIAILADRLAGKIKEPATFVSSLLDGLPKSAITPDGIRSCIKELRRRKLNRDLLRATERFVSEELRTGEIDDEGMNGLVSMIIEREAMKRPDNGDGTPVLIRLNTVKPEPVTWLWPGHIPAGKITLLSGNPGTGKSFFALDLAARITTGRPAPDGAPLQSGACLFLVGEDGLADTIRTRADMLGADPSKVVVLDGVEGRDGQARFFRFDEHMTSLEKAAGMIPGLRMIVIDPIASFLGRLDANKQGDARAVMDPLARIAENCCVSVFILAHLNKAQAAGAVYRTSGSQQWAAAARAVFYLAPDPDDPDQRILGPMKLNLARWPHKLTFSIGDNGPEKYQIREDDHRSPDDILQTLPSPGAGAARQKATAWLQAQLAIGPKKASEIECEAAEAGISESTLNRVKRELGVDSYLDAASFPKRWYWMLPNQGVHA